MNTAGRGVFKHRLAAINVDYHTVYQQRCNAMPTFVMVQLDCQAQTSRQRDEFSSF